MSNNSIGSIGSIGNNIFKSNYLQELPEDIKILIYKYVYKNNYTCVLNELIANVDNQKHYNNLTQFLIYQEEPKLNLLNYLSRNSIAQKKHHVSNSILSCYKNQLASNNIFKANINKLKFALNIFKYLDKRIAQTFVNFTKKSEYTTHFTYNIYIDEKGEYFVLEYDKNFCCFAELYLVLLIFWQYIRIKLYEFYEVHKEAYNIHVNNLIRNDYNSVHHSWYTANMTEDILNKNLEKIKKENEKLYRKITRHRNNVDKTECFYINFEIRNNIETYIIDDNSIIILLKEL
jgi:hypothetical protein